MPSLRPLPKLGAIVIVRGIRCQIVAVHPFGTLDVTEISGPRAWRISGLPFH